MTISTGRFTLFFRIYIIDGFGTLHGLLARRFGPREADLKYVVVVAFDVFG